MQTEHEPVWAELHYKQDANILQKVKLHVPKHKGQLQSEDLQLPKELLDYCFVGSFNLNLLNIAQPHPRRSPKKLRRDLNINKKKAMILWSKRYR